jgi:hypothetical protein
MAVEGSWRALGKVAVPEDPTSKSIYRRPGKYFKTLDRELSFPCGELFRIYRALGLVYCVCQGSFEHPEGRWHNDAKEPKFIGADDFAESRAPRPQPRMS